MQETYIQNKVRESLMPINRWYILIIIGMLYLTSVSANEEFNIGYTGNDEIKLKTFGGNKEFRFSITIRIDEITEDIVPEGVIISGGGGTKVPLNITEDEEIQIRSLSEWITELGNKILPNNPKLGINIVRGMVSCIGLVLIYLVFFVTDSLLVLLTKKIKNKKDKGQKNEQNKK